jgi:hypothetical protein
VTTVALSIQTPYLEATSFAADLLQRARQPPVAG